MFHLLFEYFTEKTGIGEKSFQEISKYFEGTFAKRNEILLSPGEICRFFIFVNKGCIRLFTVNEKGSELTRYIAFEKSFGTALSSLITQKPSNEYIQSIEKSELLVIKRDHFFNLVETSPVFNKIYRHILESAYLTTQQRIYGFQGFGALDKLKWLLNHQPKVLTRISNKIIASYLGVTPYTLSRLKAEL